jgi:hypothetical protein
MQTFRYGVPPDLGLVRVLSEGIFLYNEALENWINFSSEKAPGCV